MLRVRVYSVLLGLLMIAADQASKIWVLGILDAPIAITPFFNLVLVFNHGVTFGLFAQSEQAGVWLLVGLAGLICLYLLWLWRQSQNRFEIMILMTVIGGAIGNVIDRIRLGGVVDFLDFHLAGYHWPAFNLADTAIVVGIGCYVIVQLKSGKRQ